MNRHHTIKPNSLSERITWRTLDGRYVSGYIIMWSSSRQAWLTKVIGSDHNAYVSTKDIIPTKHNEQHYAKR